MHSNTTPYFLNRKTNQLRRAASLPGNSTNVAILTRAIYKFSSWHWKQVFLRREYFIHILSLIPLKVPQDSHSSAWCELSKHGLPSAGRFHLSAQGNRSRRCVRTRSGAAHGHTHPFPAPAGSERCPAAPKLSCTPDATLHPCSIPPGTSTRIAQRRSCISLCWSWSCLSSQDTHGQTFSRHTASARPLLAVGSPHIPTCICAQDVTLTLHTKTFPQKPAESAQCRVHQYLGKPREASWKNPPGCFCIASCQHNP